MREPTRAIFSKTPPNVKLYYDRQSDSLYIELLEKSSVDSREVAPGVVLDFDADGRLVGIDIDRPSQVVDLCRVDTQGLPVV